MVNSYNVRTLTDMAAIPEDRWPAFLEELPALLHQVRNVLDMQRAIHVMADLPLPSEEDTFRTLGKVEWVDDDLGNVTTTVSMQGEDGESLGAMKVKQSLRRNDYLVETTGVFDELVSNGGRND